MSRFMKFLIPAVFALSLWCGASARAQTGLVDQGYAALESGDPERAQALADQALTTAQSDEARFAALSLLADIAFDYDAADQALALAQQADDLAQTLFGPIHAARLSSLDRVAILHNDLGQPADAIRAFTRMQRISRAIEAEPQNRLYDTLNLAGVFLEMEAPRDASVLASDALWMAEDLEGKFSEPYASAALIRAEAQLALGHPVEGLVSLLPILEAGLDAYLSEWPELGAQVDTVFAQYDAAAQTKGDIGTVQDTWLTLAATRRDARAPFPWDGFETRFLPAFAGGQLEQADTIARQLFAGLLADDPRPAEVYQVLAQSYLARGDPANALPWVQRLFSYPTGFLAAFLDTSAELTNPVADWLIAQGRTTEGLALTQTALQTTRVAYGDQAAPTQALRLAYASQLSVAGQPATAGQQLADVQSALTQQTDPYLRAWALFEAGQQALEAGRVNPGRDQINSAIVTFDQAALVPDPLFIDMLRSAAEAELRAGATTAAVTLAKRAADQAAAFYGPTARETLVIQLTLLNSLFADEQGEQATALFNQMRNQVDQSLSAGDPLRQVVVLAGLQNIAPEDPDFDSAALITSLMPDQSDTAAPSGVRATVLVAAAQITYDAGQVALAETLLSEAEAMLTFDNDAATLLRARLHLDANRVDQALALYDSVTARAFEPGRAPPTHLPYHLEALHRSLNQTPGQDSAALLDQAFTLVQRVNTTQAGAALGQATARWQVPPDLARDLRALQDGEAQATALRDQVTTALAEGNNPAPLRAALQDSVDRQHARRAQLAQDHPSFDAFGTGRPISLKAVQSVLAPDEALIVIASTNQTTAQGQSVGQVTLIRHDRVAMTGLARRDDLARLSEALRCQAALTDTRCALHGAAGTRGSFSLDPADTDERPDFDYDIAHLAYQAVLQDFAEDLTGARTLIFVPDAATVAMPFHLMVTQPTDAGTGFTQAPWLIRDVAIAVAPSVASFHALRSSRTTSGRAPRFLGIGDPLIGHQANGATPYPCTPGEDVLVAALDPTPLLTRAATDPTALRQLSALPETRCELADIAALFGADQRVLVQDQARESTIKSLSQSGALSKFSVISFATHGLIAGEIGNAEAGLVLTPPNSAQAQDDGLLTIDEIAALRLNAEFVILSACNTALGRAASDEALSGMASAFFYAGARSLLVSHWPVYSDAAVQLTTHLLRLRRDQPRISRAQAVQSAMLAALDDPFADARQTHPAYWAPFMVVGAD